MKKNILKKLSACFVMFLLLSNSAYSVEFADVSDRFWAYRQIDKLTDEKILSGYENDLFMPQKLVTRAEYAAMIIKAIGQEDIPIETMHSFEDIDYTHWAWNYVIRAVNLDILKPVDSYFYPNDYVTRSEMITFLVNILKSEDITKKEAITALQNAYLDFDDIPDWFKVTAGKAEFLNVIAKEPPRENYLDYDKYITRAQMAVFLCNLREKIDSYTQERIKEEKSPKKGEGITAENVTRVGDVVTLPAKTVLPIIIMGQVSSDDTPEGQVIQAKFPNNIIDAQNNILLSNDSILIGKVLDTTRSKNFVRNGGIIFEFTGINKKDNYTRIYALAEFHAKGKKFIKGREFVAKDGQILNIRLYRPMRVNIVTGEVLD